MITEKIPMKIPTFKYNRKPVLAIVGSAFVATLGSANVAPADTNPFVAVELDSGYELAAKDAEGKCGEGKCGADSTDSADKDTEGKCGEGKCGTDKDAEGKCGEGKSADNSDKDAEGKCGEGKCGSTA